MTGHDADAREAMQRYLALPSSGPLKTTASLGPDPPNAGPRLADGIKRWHDGLRKAGRPDS
jgi:hypothetical protein